VLSPKYRSARAVSTPTSGYLAACKAVTLVYHAGFCVLSQRLVFLRAPAPSLPCLHGSVPPAPRRMDGETASATSATGYAAPEPARVARHWLVLAVALLFTLAAGRAVEDAGRPVHGPPVARTGARVLSIVGWGLARLCAVFKQPCPWPPTCFRPERLPPPSPRLAITYHAPGPLSGPLPQLGGEELGFGQDAGSKAPLAPPGPLSRPSPQPGGKELVKQQDARPSSPFPQIGGKGPGDRGPGRRGEELAKQQDIRASSPCPQFGGRQPSPLAGSGTGAGG